MALELDAARTERLKSLRGNLSLWALGLSVLTFKGWQWYFSYPAEAEVAILGGILRLKMSYLASVITFVLGWLVGIYSLKNLQRVMVQFFRPLGLVNDREARDFFTAPATMMFSLALLLFVLDTVTANIAYKITSRYEVFAMLPRGNGTFLILPDGKTAERTSLKPDQTIRIALRGRGDSQVLLIRDQYNLVTLDALKFTRGNFRSRIESPDLIAASPSDPKQSPVRGRKGTGLFEIELRGPLRYSSTRVSVTITPLGEEVKRGGWVQPGSGSDCPERSGQPYSRKLLQALCDNRSLFSVWEAVPAYHEKVEGVESTIVSHSIGQYDATVRFEKARVDISGDSFETREAKEIVAVEREAK